MGIHRIASRIKRKASHVIHRLQRRQFVHFLHIGKTGGSAVKYALKNNLVSDKYVIYLHKHGVKLRSVPRGDKVFFFLRDPVDRFVSGFYSRKRRGQPRIFSPWTQEEEVAFGRFQTPNQLAVALSSGDKEERAKGQYAMKSIAHVRDSYWNWLESENYLRARHSDILLVGFQENLTQDFETLKSRLNLPDNVKLPDDDILSHRNPRDLDKALDDEALRNLRDWYRNDYRLISLCKAITEQDGCGGSLGTAQQDAAPDGDSATLHPRQ
jgi:hypothetical protein